MVEGSAAEVTSSCLHRAHFARKPSRPTGFRISAHYLERAGPKQFDKFFDRSPTVATHEFERDFAYLVEPFVPTDPREQSQDLVPVFGPKHVNGIVGRVMA